MTQDAGATREDFEGLAAALLDYAQHFYSTHTDELLSMVGILRRAPETEEAGEQGYEIGMIQAAALKTHGINSRDEMLAMMHDTAARPDVLVVAHMGEAWTVPTEAPGATREREEILTLQLLSAEAQALQLCRLTRGPARTFVESGLLCFDSPEKPVEAPLFRARKAYN